MKKIEIKLIGLNHYSEQTHPLFQTWQYRSEQWKILAVKGLTWDGIIFFKRRFPGSMIKTSKNIKHKKSKIYNT